MKFLTILASTSALALLCACGGGSSGDGTPAEGTGPTSPTKSAYEPLMSTAAKTSTLGGVAIRSNGASGATEVVTISGTTVHNAGITTITDGTYSLTDPDGFNGSTLLSDGTSTITTDGVLGFTGSYQYVTAYEQGV